MPISTVPFCTASSTSGPARFHRRRKVELEFVVGGLCDSLAHDVDGRRKLVSSVFGQLAVIRHFSPGMDCAIAARNRHRTALQVP